MKIILASTSPRRIELMAQAGYTVEVRKPEADETPQKGEKPEALVRRLCRAKAQSVIEQLRTGEEGLVIAADTIVVSPDGKKILGKPVHEADARKMLTLLSGHVHTVLTGYCIWERAPGKAERTLVRVVRSKVKLRALSKKQIEVYVKTGEPMDKAGSYAAQGLGMALVERISGSYTNVVGLPMSQLLSDLDARFGVSFFAKIRN
jgi:septum formation protein